MRTIRHLTKVSTLTGVALTSLLVSSHPVAAQRACVVTDSGNVVCGRLQQNSQNSSNARNQTVELEDINVTLQGCKRSSSNLNCHFLLTTKQDGRGYLFCGKSKMFDTFGKEYFCQQGLLGQTKSEYDMYAGTRMLKGVPLRATVTFREVPTQVKEILAIEIGVDFNGTLFNNGAIFRSITISE